MNLYTSDLYHHRVSVCVPVAHSKIFSEWAIRVFAVVFINTIFLNYKINVIKLKYSSARNQLRFLPALQQVLHSAADTPCFNE